MGEVVWLSEGKKVENERLPNLDARFLRGKSEPEYKTTGKLLENGDRAILVVDGENSGKLFLIRTKGIMGSTFKKLYIISSNLWEYVEIILRKQQDVFRNNKKGAAIPHLNKDLFKTLLAPFPFIRAKADCRGWMHCCRCVRDWIKSHKAHCA